jgi:cytochrome c-type biogenesis protein CcmH
VKSFLAALLAGLVLAPVALAADCPKTTLGDVEDEVMCPVCGTSLALATEAPQANRERQFIERQIATCKSKDEIKKALAAEFGDGVLAQPKEKGFNLAAYLVPLLAIGAAAGALALAVLRRRRRPALAAGPDPPAPRAADEKRLDEDLRRYEL